MSVGAFRVPGNVGGECDPLTWQLLNSDLELIENGSVEDPCGFELVTIAPDAIAVVKNSAGTTLDTENIPSNVSEDIIVSDSTAVIKNSAGTTLDTEAIPAGASEDIIVSDSTAVVKNLNGTTLVTEAIPAGASENITAPIPLKFVWGAGQNRTITFTITDDEAGSYDTFTQDGSSGTITYSKNGGAFAALTGTISFVVGDTVALDRTTFSAAGFSKWAP